MTVLRYGADSSVHLEFAEGVRPEECGTPKGSPLDDLAAAAAAALGEPLDYPSLARSTTPGDRVVVTLERALPQAAQITAAVVHALVAAGVEPDGISVLRTEAGVDSGEENPIGRIEPAIAQRLRLLTHDPASRRELAYLAASEGGEPILLNRLLTDADLVLPIGCVRAERTAGYFGIHSSIFPEFSDLPTQSRFRRTECLRDEHRLHRDLAEEVRHVAWLLGINFTIQLVPAGGDGVLHVVAGQSDSVHRRSRELYQAAWACQVARRASLVVAAIEGGPQQQTWENLGNTLETAGNIVEEGGAIAVCCDLAVRPGPAVQRMVAARSREAVLRQIRRDGPTDALPAAQLSKALDRDRVYLLSRLEPSLVEELDMTPVAGPEELARLAHRHASCIVLANGPTAVVTVEEP